MKHLYGLFAIAACAGGGNQTGTNPDGSVDHHPDGATGPTVHMIDDLEDGDGAILMKEHRVGAWYTYDDGTAGGMHVFPTWMTFVVSPGGANSSRNAARLAYSGFSTWGAGLGFNLSDPGNGAGGSSKHAYDASAYTALTLWAKAAAPMTLRVNLPDVQTDAAGGMCTTGCNDDFGADLSLGTDWQPFTIEFAAATQVGWSGTKLTALQASGMFAVHLQGGPGAFDFEVDDVAFLQ